MSNQGNIIDGWTRAELSRLLAQAIAHHNVGNIAHADHSAKALIELLRDHSILIDNRSFDRT